MINFGKPINVLILFVAVLAGVPGLTHAAPPDLSEIPKSGRIWMGLEEGTIRPAAYQQFRSDVDATVKLHVADGDLLSSGQHWATLDPEQLEIERQALELEIDKRNLQRVKDDYDADQTRVALLLEIQDAYRKLEDLTDASQSSALDEGLRQRAREAVKIMKRRIEILEQRASNERLEEESRLKELESDLQLQRTRKQLLDLERRSKQISRHGGRLRLSDDFKKRMERATPEEKIWVSAGDILGTVLDDTRYEIHVPASNSAMLQLPEDEIGIFIQDGQTGTLIPGSFLRIDEMESGLEIKRTYIFSVPDERIEAAREAGGQKQLVHVYRMFGKEHHLIHKKDIAFADPDVLMRSGWTGLVRHLWPDSRIIQVGPQTIAVEEANEN